jgi:hypothetical protein
MLKSRWNTLSVIPFIPLTTAAPQAAKEESAPYIALHQRLERTSSLLTTTT